MKKCLNVLMVLTLILFISGCNKEVKTQTGNSTADSITMVETAAWPTSAWSTSTPEQQGINFEMLTKADSKINDNYPNVYSLLVVRNGFLVYEKYYQAMDETDDNPVYSVTKSVMSALTGIALRDGIIHDIDQNISEYLPDYFTQLDDIHKNKIKIKNVLTMTGGLASIDSDFASFYSSSDWLTYVLSQPLEDKPGKKFAYNSGLTQFLSVIISEASGMSMKDYANQYLFNKIGTSIKFWETDKNGNNAGGFGICMTPRDMAKFGYLYLNNGIWDGKQIIPKKWVDDSTQKQITTSEDADYGYLFWLQTIKDNVHNKKYFTYRAAGLGGQYIMVIPDLDMVVVITANYNKPSNDNSNTLDIIKDYIIPAVD